MYKIAQYPKKEYYYKLVKGHHKCLCITLSRNKLYSLKSSLFSFGFIKLQILLGVPITRSTES